VVDQGVIPADKSRSLDLNSIVAKPVLGRSIADQGATGKAKDSAMYEDVKRAPVRAGKPPSRNYPTFTPPWAPLGSYSTPPVTSARPPNAPDQFAIGERPAARGPVIMRPTFSPGRRGNGVFVPARFLRDGGNSNPERGPPAVTALPVDRIAGGATQASASTEQHSDAIDIPSRLMMGRPDHISHMAKLGSAGNVNVQSFNDCAETLVQDKSGTTCRKPSVVDTIDNAPTATVQGWHSRGKRDAEGSLEASGSPSQDSTQSGNSSATDVLVAPGSDSSMGVNSAVAFALNQFLDSPQGALHPLEQKSKSSVDYRETNLQDNLVPEDEKQIPVEDPDLDEQPRERNLVQDNSGTPCRKPSLSRVDTVVNAPTVAVQEWRSGGKYAEASWVASGSLAQDSTQSGTFSTADVLGVPGSDSSEEVNSAVDFALNQGLESSHGTLRRETNFQDNLVPEDEKQTAVEDPDPEQIVDAHAARGPSGMGERADSCDKQSKHQKRVVARARPVGFVSRPGRQSKYQVRVVVRARPNGVVSRPGRPVPKKHWNTVLAGMLNPAPIVRLRNGDSFVHPVLPPGWKVRVCKSADKPVYSHPDYGKSFYPPVPLPGPDGTVYGTTFVKSEDQWEDLSCGSDVSTPECNVAGFLHEVESRESSHHPNTNTPISVSELRNESSSVKEAASRSPPHDVKVACREPCSETAGAVGNDAWSSPLEEETYIHSVHSKRSQDIRSGVELAVNPISSASLGTDFSENHVEQAQSLDHDAARSTALYESVSESSPRADCVVNQHQRSTKPVPLSVVGPTTPDRTPQENSGGDVILNGGERSQRSSADVLVHHLQASGDRVSGAAPSSPLLVEGVHDAFEGAEANVETPCQGGSVSKGDEGSSSSSPMPQGDFGESVGGTPVSEISSHGNDSGSVDKHLHPRHTSAAAGPGQHVTPVEFIRFKTPANDKRERGSQVSGASCSPDNRSVGSVRSIASCMSHRVLYPPMPLCSLQHLENCSPMEARLPKKKKKRHDPRGSRRPSKAASHVRPQDFDKVVTVSKRKTKSKAATPPQRPFLPIQRKKSLKKMMRLPLSRNTLEMASLERLGDY
jgi:hypothetical protein